MPHYFSDRESTRRQDPATDSPSPTSWKRGSGGTSAGGLARRAFERSTHTSEVLSKSGGRYYEKARVGDGSKLFSRGESNITSTYCTCVLTLGANDLKSMRIRAWSQRAEDDY